METETVALLPTRNLILNLARTNRLAYAIVLPNQDLALTESLYRRIIARLSDPETFEFVWKEPGIHIDSEELTYYPHVEADELTDISTYPLPHEHVWIETAVKNPFDGPDRMYIWDLQRTKSRNGYNAIPLVFVDGKLSFHGCEIDFHPDIVNDNGTRGAFEMWCHFPNYEKTYDPLEFQDHALMLGRFLRLLCLPKVRIETTNPDEKSNARRVKRGQSAYAKRSIVRIDPEAIYEGLPKGNVKGGHASPRPHHRRAHVRHLSNGNAVPVRECVIGMNFRDGPPPPQTFIVD